MNIRFHELPKPLRIPNDPRCTCGKPIGIVLKPGKHIHPCPVHPEKYISSGPNVVWR